MPKEQTSNEDELTPPQIIVKWGGNTGKDLAAQFEATEQAIKRPIKEAQLPALRADTQDCLIRGDYFFSVQQSLHRAMAGVEHLKKAYEAYALNYRHIGLIVEEIMDRGSSLRSTCKELKLRFHTGREAEAIARLTKSDDDLRQKINDFNPDLSLNKSVFLRYLAGEDVTPPPKPVKFDREKPKGEETEEERAEREQARAEGLALAALNQLLDVMYEDTTYPYCIQAGYAEALAFKQRTESRAMRERYRACLLVLLKVIERRGK